VINSPVWQSLTSAFEDLIPAAGEEGLGGVLEDLNPMMESLSGFIDQFAQEIKDNGLVETLKKYVGEAFSGLGGMIKEFLFGSSGPSEEQQQRQQNLQQERQQILSDPQAQTRRGNRLSGDQKERLAEINSELKSLQDTGSEGVLSGLLPDFNAFTAILTGGALIGGLAALGKAFGVFGSPQVAAGVAVFTGALVGTGVAIMAAGKGIDLAGEGIQKVAGGLERMSELKDVAKLSDIGVALGSMGTALKDLAVGGALESITSFFGADSPFDKIIQGVNKFANIDNAAFANLMHTSTSLKNIGDADFDNSGMDSYTDNIKTLALAVGSIDPYTLDSIKSFASTDFGQSVTNLSDISKIEFDSSSIESYRKSIENLTRALEGLNSELQEDNDSGLFGQNKNMSAGELLGSQQGSSQTGSGEKLDQLNRVMQDILGVLLQSNDMTNKQLRATRGMVGNLY
jgi:hypothetical protein